MTGVLIRRPGFNYSQLPAEVNRRKKFRDVFDSRTESLGAVKPFPLLLFEKQRVFLQHGAAPGGFSDDRIELLGEKGFNVFACQLPCGVANARMNVKGPTASLLPRNYHFTTVERKHPDGGFVEPCESKIGDAPL